MTIYALYIYDRHCECVYYQDWHRTRLPRPPADGNFRAGVARYTATPQLNPSGGADNLPLAPGQGLRVQVKPGSSAVSGGGGESGTKPKAQGLPFDEEAKLVYGVVLSLRNMVKKLSGRDEAFTSYQTSVYKLHLYETLSGYRFILLSNPLADSLRFVLRQVYAGPFLENVVRNPLVELGGRERGVDNDQFRASTDKYIRGLSIFGA